MNTFGGAFGFDNAALNPAEIDVADITSGSWGLLGLNDNFGAVYEASGSATLTDTVFDAASAQAPVLTPLWLLSLGLVGIAVQRRLNQKIKVG